MSELYLPKDKADKLVEVMWQCICTPWYEEFRPTFEKMGIAELAEWVTTQMGNTFDVEQRGSNYINLSKSNFTAIDSPKCTIPPAGWECSRERGHVGPCAAYPAEVKSTDSTLAVYEETCHVSDARNFIERMVTMVERRPGAELVSLTNQDDPRRPSYATYFAVIRFPS